MPEYSDYVVYVDESGDHGLKHIDPNYPMFVLAFCIIQKDIYSEEVTTAVSDFKFKHFGHDQVVLHERDIRKTQEPFKFLHDKERREEFYDDLNTLMRRSDFTLVATAIRKRALDKKYEDPANPYDLALAYGLERVEWFLRERREGPATTHVVVESRGEKEDDDLELAFRRVCDGANQFNEKLPFQIVFADKQSNSAGLQLADLMARPIGRKILKPGQDNRAFDILEEKFRRSDSGRVEGYGLKIFP